jgi:hypothetical protein
MQAMTAFGGPMSICHSLQMTVKRCWPTTRARSNRQTGRKAAATNRPADWDDQWLRLVKSFDAGGPRYRWLNASHFVAERRLLGTRSITAAHSRDILN